MVSYEELKDTSEMAEGSLHRMQSEIHHLRRPPSLSDSYATSIQNIERASSFRCRELPIIIERNEPLPVNDYYEIVSNLVLRFLFHIFLISIFETVFFFHYVSLLEDNGILGTIDSFTGTIVQSCSNLTVVERSVINKYIAPYVNVSNIKRIGSSVHYDRLAANHALFVKSWLYVGSIGGLFAFVYSLSYIKHTKINLYAVFVENAGFVCMLAFYEFMFFSTVIVPYTPISSQEILMGTLMQLENECGVF